MTIDYFVSIILVNSDSFLIYLCAVCNIRLLTSFFSGASRSDEGKI